jgi:hypothetical protein
MTGAGFNKTKGPKKLRGCIAASPMVPFGFALTSSSLLSFSLPFYSPPNFLKFTPALLAERVFNLMYSDTDLSCQEESEANEKKNEITISEAGKPECAEAWARIIPTDSTCSEKPSPRRLWDYRLTSAAGPEENSRCGAGGGSHLRTGYA